MTSQSDLPDVDWSPLPWPDEGGDPFDPASSRTLWVASRNGGLSRTFESGDWQDWGSLGAFEKALPVGYSVLKGRERLAVCHAGGVVREWSPTTERPRGSAAPPRGHSVAFLELRAGHWYVQDEDVEDYDVALERAVRLSREGARRSLVLRNLRLVNWH